MRRNPITEPNSFMPVCRRYMEPGYIALMYPAATGIPNAWIIRRPSVIPLGGVVWAESGLATGVCLIIIHAFGMPAAVYERKRKGRKFDKFQSP